MLCRDSGLLRDTRNIMGTSESVFERLPAREGRTSIIFDDSKNGNLFSVIETCY